MDNVMEMQRDLLPSKGKSTARGIRARSSQPGSKREDYQESGGQWVLAEHKK